MALGESRFRTMFERTADALVVLDVRAGHFTDCNQAALDMMPNVYSFPLGLKAFHEANQARVREELRLVH